GDEFKIRCLIQDGLISTTGFRNLIRLEEAEQQWGVSKEQVDALVSQHLLRRQNRNSMDYCELAHDRLVDPVRNDNDAWLKKQPVWKREARLWRLRGTFSGLLPLKSIREAQSVLEHAPETL